MNEERARIFIVDDDASFCRSFSRLMRSAGFDVEVHSAQSFLEKEIYTGKSCLFLDVRMPGLNGLELQQELLRRNILIPIVFITALEEPTARIDAMQAGAVDFLLKPTDAESLFDAIDLALEQDTRRKKPSAET